MKGCEFQMKMKSVKAVLIFLLSFSRYGHRVSVVEYEGTEYEKKGCWVENEVTAYYNMTETGIRLLRQRRPVC